VQNLFGFCKFSNLDVPVRFLIVFVSVGLCMQIEFEPEYHVNFGNPDIDEKPPMALEEMLQKVISSIDLVQFYVYPRKCLCSYILFLLSLELGMH
jgi:hypothetical protein